MSLTRFLPCGRGPDDGEGNGQRQEVSLLDALTGQHEEEDAGDDDRGAHLPPWQHGDDAALSSALNEVPSRTMTYPGCCHLDPPVSAAGSARRFSPMRPVSERRRAGASAAPRLPPHFVLGAHLGQTQRRRQESAQR